MEELLQNLVKTFFESFQTNVPRISKDCFILTKILLYAGAITIYSITFVVLLSVALIILIIAAPVSLLYRFLFSI